jgi:hypothetical protein
MANRSIRQTGCLFCGNEDGKFESEEHVIPIALGNSVESGLVESELVLPPGEICDKCNQGRLSARDSALVSWPPISMFRSLAQIRNRRGELVDAVEKTQWRVKLNPQEPRLFRLRADASTSEGSGRDQVARALCKVALETRWLEDPLDARSNRWDEIAAAAIGGPLPSELAMGLTQPHDVADIDLTPSSDVLVDDDSGALRIGCVLYVVGLRLTLVVGHGPVALPETAWWRIDPSMHKLAGPGSMWADVSGVAASATRSRSLANPDPPRRHSSRLPTHHAGAKLFLLPSRDDPG